MVAVTKELIFKGRSEAGGWNKAQLALFGIAWPPSRFWMDRGIIGKEISQATADTFLSLKGQTKEKLRSERDDRLKSGARLEMRLDADGNWYGSLSMGDVVVTAVASSPKAMAGKLCKKWSHRK